MTGNQVFVLVTFTPDITRRGKVGIHLELNYWLEGLHTSVEDSHVKIFAELEE